MSEAKSICASEEKPERITPCKVCGRRFFQKLLCRTQSYCSVACAGVGRRLTPERKLLQYKIMVVWRGMLNRCYKESHLSYPYYGGSGIRVHEEWRTSMHAFRSWALSNGYAIGLRLDRIDSRGDYSPSNCRFITPKDNVHRIGKITRRKTLSRYKGVSRSKSKLKPWVATICLNGKNKNLGFFETEEEAARACDAAARKRSPGHAYLNFPGEAP